jgi:DNA modification methylase
MNTTSLKLSQVKINKANPRTISKDKFQKLVNSLLVFPEMLAIRPVVVDGQLTALGGNMRLNALQAIAKMSPDEVAQRLASTPEYAASAHDEKQRLVEYWGNWLQSPTVAVIDGSTLTESERRQFIIKDNVSFGQWDYDALANDWDTPQLEDWGLDLWNWDVKDGSAGKNECESKEAGGTAAEGSSQTYGSLCDRFVIPPFSVLDTRKGYWQSRKRLWRGIIGDMGESRQDTLIQSPEIKYKEIYKQSRTQREQLGVSFKEYLDKYVSDDVKERAASKVLAKGVSLLDPVLSEIICKWFTPAKGAKVFDCFAGDSVFGFVSAYVGHDFVGIELRKEQATLNNRRAAGMTARYICDDGQNVAQHIESESQDLLFSCPPYFDLEKYSDLPNDASNQGSYEEFMMILRNAFTAAIGCLKENRFAVIVVGDVRDKRTGFYYDFCGDIKRIFAAGGMSLYNELILVEPAASTAMRAGRTMDTRKVAKMHQNVLVFFKGDPKQIKKEFPKIEYTEEDLSKTESGETGSESETE